MKTTIIIIIEIQRLSSEDPYYHLLYVRISSITPVKKPKNLYVVGVPEYYYWLVQHYYMQYTTKYYNRGK